jgi:hypothetical protein
MTGNCRIIKWSATWGCGGLAAAGLVPAHVWARALTQPKLKLSRKVAAGGPIFTGVSQTGRTLHLPT